MIFLFGEDMFVMLFFSTQRNMVGGFNNGCLVFSMIRRFSLEQDTFVSWISFSRAVASYLPTCTSLPGCLECVSFECANRHCWRAAPLSIRTQECLWNAFAVLLNDRHVLLR